MAENTSNETNAVPRFREAYDRLLEEIRSVPEHELFQITVDVPSALTTALGVLPEIRALRERIEQEMQRFDLQRFDKLEAYALAMGHAHARYLASSAAPESMTELATNGSALRDLLVADATALAQRGFIDGQKLKSLKGTSGYRNLAFDLFTLATLLRERWATISSRTGVQMAELDRAETLADHLLTALGEREQAPSVTVETTSIRQRAFVLFMNAYDDARRAVTYLRWHDGDVDDIAPSLYAGRGTGKRKDAPPTAAGVKPEQHAEPTTGVLPVPGAAIAEPATAAIGMPGGHPFGRA